MVTRRELLMDFASHDPSTSADVPAATPPTQRKPWSTPVVEELLVQQTATNPGVGSDGGIADCTRH